jgi:pimeloyl-ACP methyl ester carboxylesterase
LHERDTFERLDNTAAGFPCGLPSGEPAHTWALTSMRMHTVSFVCFAALALQLIGPAPAQMPGGSPALLTKNLVAIEGGRHLNMVCIGKGSPAAVFEYGANGHILDWRKVQPGVSAFTRACFYDRAGYGFSEPAARAMTAENVTDDLHALLRSVQLRPVVLVGHALGGLYATLYADRFGAEVAGLVLVDPDFAGQLLWGRSANEIARDVTAYDRSLANLSDCAELARAGNLSFGNPHGCFQRAPAAAEAETAGLMEQYLKPFRYESALSEARNFFWYGSRADTEDGTEERSAVASFADKPMIVLTAGVPPLFPGETAATQRQFALDWKAGHDRLAARSSRGESFFVRGATHSIADDQPLAVIDAIRNVVLDARLSSRAKATASAR